MKIAISGISGHLGYAVYQSLLATGYNKNDLIGLARNVEKAQAKLGTDALIRFADFDNFQSLKQALNGVNRLLLVSTNEPDTQRRVAQHANAITAAKENHVSLIVYTSGTKPDANPLGAAHQLTEQIIKQSNIPYVILRNGYYLEAKLGDVKKAQLNQPIMTNTGKGKFGLALREEYAQAAANALIGNTYNRTYDLAANLINYTEWAKVISHVLNKPVQLIELSDQQMENAMLNQGTRTPVAHLLTAANAAIRNGAADISSTDFAELLGHQPQSLEKSLKSLL